MNVNLLDSIQEEVNTYSRLDLWSTDAPDLIPKWSALVSAEPKRFIDNNSSVDPASLQNFRKLQVFISDTPAWRVSKFSLKNKVSGGRRGGEKMLRECLTVLKDNGYDHLLLKYPCHPAGNPHVYRFQGFQYTFRWFKHIYFLGLLKQQLGSILENNFVGLDIGSSYGIFSSLVKQEYPESHHVLVDFPEQLILAYYFLKTCLPQARIAGIQEVSEMETITREFIEQYDFVLVPCPLYQRLSPGSVDLVTNFASLGEMTRKWFDDYLQSPPFLGAQYFFTANRVQSYPTYDTDLTILDYPIWEPSKRIRFGICPAFCGYYEYVKRHLVLYDKQAYPAYFEYVGKI